MEEKNPSPNAAPRENKMGVMPIGRLLAGMGGAHDDLDAGTGIL